MKRFTPNQLSTSIKLACLASTVLAMPTVIAAEQAGATDETEVIQIRGIRGSVVKSINSKRFSDSIVDAVSAEDVGKFPDQNVAESLARITGVSLTRSFGEGERVSIRGTNENQNRTLLNGQAVGSVDWWTDSPASRGFNYTMLPSEIVSGLEVYKSPEADVDEGSIGGTVIVKTRKPLDLDAHTISGSAMAQYSETSGETDPVLSAMYSWKNEDETFGALISIVRQQRSLRRDGLEAWSWGENDITLTSGETVEDVYAPGGGGSAMFSQERVRTGVNAAIQFRPTDEIELGFNLLDSTLEADNENQNFLWLTDFGGNQYDSVQTTNHPQVGEFVTAGSFSANEDGTPNILDETKVRNSKLETKVYDFTAKHTGDIWTTSGQIGFTEGSGGSQADRSVGWVGNYDWNYDVSQTKNVQTSYGADPKDGSKWNLDYLRYDRNDAKDEETYAQLDLERDIDVAVFNKLKFGVKYRDHDRSNTKYTTDAKTDLNWSLADYSLTMPSDYLDGMGNSGTLTNYAITNSDKVRAEGDALNWDYRVLHASSYAVGEKIYAGYVKAGIETDGLRGNMGVRLVKTKQKTGAYANTTWVEIEKDYTDILPSINLAIDLEEDLLFRVAASRVMSRPDYNQMTPATVYNTETQTGTGGSADLEPTRANQFDVGLEWYFDEASLLSAAFFYKDIQSYVETTNVDEVFEGVNIAIQRPRNGRAGKVQGLEFGYQQELLEGFGVNANYTFVDSETVNSDGEKTEVPGVSEHTVNLSAYYEDDLMSGRVSYNYRAGYDTGRAWPGYVDDYAQVDANFAYNVTENVKIVVEGLNLFDEKVFTYQSEGVEQALTSYYRNGRRFVTGVRVNF